MIVFDYFTAAAAIYCCYCYYSWCCSRSLLLLLSSLCVLFLARIWFYYMSVISNFWYSVCIVTNNHSQIFTLINGVYVISLFCFYSFWYLFRRRNRFQSPVKQQPCSIKPKMETKSENRIKPKKKRARIQEWEQK